jgi:hypothetical protein
METTPPPTLEIHPQPTIVQLPENVPKFLDASKLLKARAVVPEPQQQIPADVYYDFSA